MIYYADKKSTATPNPTIDIGRAVLETMLKSIVDDKLPLTEVPPEEVPEGLEGATANLTGPNDPSLEVGVQVSYKDVTAEVVTIQVEETHVVYKIEFHYKGN